MMRRRRLLALTGGLTTSAIAGCLETDTEPAERNGNDTGTTDDSSEEAAGVPDDSEAWTEPEWPSGPYEEYETALVEIEGDGGEPLGRVKTAVARSGDERKLGLSDADSMPENGGMLFAYDASSDHTFWMRDMSFGLDIVYVASDRTITSIHHAPEPAAGDSGTEERYQFSGTGQYVLEVTHHWTTERGVSVGDTLSFELDD